MTEAQGTSILAQGETFVQQLSDLQGLVQRLNSLMLVCFALLAVVAFFSIVSALRKSS